MNGETVPFEPEAVREYLDTAITRWRRQRDCSQSVANRTRSHGEAEVVKMAGYYIDAFQSVRVSLFGELLP